MCGRFTLRSDSNALGQHFEMELDEVHFPPPRYNIAPTQTIPVIRINPATGRRELTMQRWGLAPPWIPQEPAQAAGTPLPALFNARAETLAAKPAFREAFRARRCLIPADGFYEWQAIGRTKQPWHIHRKDHGLFAFAGLWEGGTCTIITTAPTPMMAKLHSRMPAIPGPEAYAAWLDPDASEPQALAPLLAGCGVELEMYPVSTLVNRASCDEPGCTQPLAAG